MMTFPQELPTRKQVMARHRGNGGRIALVFPVHYPRALLRAFGFLPMEVWGPPGFSTAEADAYIQVYACSVVRCGFSALVSGRLGSPDLVLVPHACDSLQGLGSMLLDFPKVECPVRPFYLPRAGGDAARDYLAAEFQAISRELEELTGLHPSGHDLLASQKREEEADRLLARLHRERGRMGLPSLDLYRVLRSREYLPAESFTNMARQLLHRHRPGTSAGIPLLLSGIVPEPMEILSLLADAGADLRGDDYACCGRRLYPPGSSADPFRRMAESLLAAPPDSLRGSSVQDRVRHLLQLSHGSGAKAVIFHGIKSCEPELFYLPQIRAALESAGLASMSLQVDLAVSLPGQVRTRIEAFLEALS